MSEAEVLREECDGIVTVTFNRPEKLNAITVAMRETLSGAVEELRDRDELRVLVIRARGRYFSAGLDTSGGLTPEFEGSAISARRWYRGSQRPRVSFRQIGDQIEAVEKPVILAAHAPCLGGALELALSCDFRLAAESAAFGLPELSLGVLPGSGGTSRLTRIVGPAWARWLVLAEQRVTAERALGMGLVHDVYPDAEFDERVDTFARHMAGQPPEAFAVGKLAIDLCADLGPAQARNIELLANGQLFTGAEYPEVLAAAMRKRGK